MKIVPIIQMLVASLVAAPVAAQETLTPSEQQIVAEVDRRTSEAVGLLEQLVNINSGTMNFDGVREVGGVLRAELDRLGFTTEWIDGTPFERAGHLVARRRGTGTHLLLIGHLDTVFEPTSPFQRFQMRESSVATGPGILDMKGGDVVIIEAMKALEAVGVLDGMTITIVMTGDEERSGRPLDLAREALIQAAVEADIALAFENGDSDPRTAVVARRGSTTWRLDVRGTPAHSSQLFQPEVGAGAVYEASRILTGFYEGLAGEPNLTFNPGVMLAGTSIEYDELETRGSAFGKNNVVAEHAVVTGDLRTLSEAQLETARAEMALIASRNLPGTSAQIRFDDGYPPLVPTDGNYRLLGMFDEVSRALGFGPVTAVDPRDAGAADVSFVADRVEMALDGLGPGGGNGHTVDEWIDLETLRLQAQRAAVLILRLTQMDPFE